MSNNSSPDKTLNATASQVSSNTSSDMIHNNSEAKVKREASRLSWVASAAIALLLLSFLLTAFFWFTQHRFEESSRVLTSQMQVLNTQYTDLQRDLKLANLQVEAHTARIAALELSLREAQEQFESLDQAWQAFNNGMEDTMLANDIERLLTLASQQLRLAGSANNAIMALETALSELIRANRVDFSSLQRAINLDLERLRAAPVVDLSALSVRLESLITLTSRAPLLVPDGALSSGQTVKVATESLKTSQDKASLVNAGVTTPVLDSSPDTNSTTTLSWWLQLRAGVASIGRGLFETIVKDLSQLISIQRVNDPNALLLSPEQGAQLRENIRARLLTAQLSLLMRQPSVWRDELTMVETLLQTRFDPQSFDTLAAINLVHELQAIPVTANLPDIAGSFAALESTRAAVARNIKEAN